MSVIFGLFGSQALDRLMGCQDIKRVLDIGCGSGAHAEIMRKLGREVVTISMTGKADFVGDYLDYKPEREFDAIWASHVLEHVPNVGLFLKKCFRELRQNGVLAITVPPYKPELVGGHLTLWTPALLLYNLILAGFDCSDARVSPCYANGPGQPPYNLSVLVRKKEAILPPLLCDAGDIERLAPYFPCPVWQNIDGRLEQIKWNDKCALPLSG